MLKTIQLSKIFGLRPVLRKINLQVTQGESVVLFGKNGAGKSTYLRILAGLSRPSTGEVHINGQVLSRQADSTRALIGYLGHRPLLYPQLSALENLLFFGKLYQIANLPARAKELLEMVDLQRFTNERTAGFSRGMQQRLALARVLLHRPKLLLLDEPWSGLDVHGCALLDRVIRTQQAEGTTVLFTTHDLAHGYALAQRALLLSGGNLVRNSQTAELAIADFFSESELSAP